MWNGQTWMLMISRDRGMLKSKTKVGLNSNWNKRWRVRAKYVQERHLPACQLSYRFTSAECRFRNGYTSDSNHLPLLNCHIIYVLDYFLKLVHDLLYAWPFGGVQTPASHKTIRQTSRQPASFVLLPDRLLTLAYRPYYCIVVFVPMIG
jgi:hypothetical protein